MIKKRILHLLLPLALMASPLAQAQTNRQSKSTAVATVVADTGGIEAYSDTSSVDTVASVRQEPALDGWDFDGWSIHSIKDIFNLDTFTTILIWGVMLLCLLMLLAVPISIGFLIYSLLRKPNKKVKDIPRMEAQKFRAEHFNNVAPLRETADDIEPSSDKHWRRGVRTLFLGVGIAICFYCFGCNKLAGIGWLIAICGAGQALTSRKN